MRIIGFDEFCRMPAGTIIAPYEPIVLKGTLEIKVDPGHPMPPDYPYCKHSFNGVMPLEPWLDEHCGLWKIGDQANASFEVYDGASCDYMEHKMFLVFEKLDIDRMINVLMWAKNGCIGTVDCNDREV